MPQFKWFARRTGVFCGFAHPSFKHSHMRAVHCHVFDAGDRRSQVIVVQVVVDDISVTTNHIIIELHIYITRLIMKVINRGGRSQVVAVQGIEGGVGGYNEFEW